MSRLIFILFALISLICPAAFPQVRLPKLISDGMVLQRDSRIIIWGWASPGERITLSFDSRKFKTMASRKGTWSVEIPSMKAGGPHAMNISGRNKITVNDIMIGDVWLCAGQSNMVHQMNLHDVRYAKDIADADYPAIRHFKIPTATDLQGPAEALTGGEWQSAVSDGVRPFSAVAYFFARKIYEKYGVPIGLINASVGGTPIEAWISEEGFAEFPESLKTIRQNKDTAYVHGLARAASDNQKGPKSHDKGVAGPVPWFSPDYKAKQWRRIDIPGYWEDQGAKDLNGVVWYRREINVPASMAGKEATVFLGRIVDADKLYVNGKEVGGTTYQYPQRRYIIPTGVLTAGTNLFVVRVTNFFGKGGFVPDKPYCVFAGRDTVDLKGYWQYKVGEAFVPRRPSSSGLRRINAQNEPTALYNAMVAPFIRFPVKGILWYQGETNAGRPEEYADLLPALIRDWREKFNDADMFFIYAQLPNFMDVSYLPSESNWAMLRESQMKALKVPNTAMTVNIDLGEWNDIHPDDKKDVGDRMALAAEKIAYGEDVVYSGPIYKDQQIKGNEIIISFTHIGGGLITDDGEPLSAFAIAGEDKKFVWAEARIEGDKIIVSSDEISDPKYVRYAWADNPDNPNLYNKEGLPASPFRTDQ